MDRRCLDPFSFGFGHSAAWTWSYINYQIFDAKYFCFTKNRKILKQKLSLNKQKILSIFVKLSLRWNDAQFLKSIFGIQRTRKSFIQI